MRHLLSWITALVAATTVFAQDNSQVVYQEYFHSKTKDSAMTAWDLRLAERTRGTNTPRIVRSPRGIRLLGIYGSEDTLNLSLYDLPPHTRVSIDIAFHIIGMWDGETDMDRFIILADGKHVVDATFSNTTSQQSWPMISPEMLYPPRATARNTNMLAYPSRIDEVYVGPMDATYETTISIAHTGASLDLMTTAALHNIVLGAEIKKWGLEYVVVRISSDTGEIQGTLSKSMQAYTSANIKDARELAEYVQDDDFPGLKAGSEFEGGLHITISKAECHSCGDYCLWYSYRFYTDGWVNVWSNKPAKGQSTYSIKLTPEELDSIRINIAECLESTLVKEYHNAEYEEAHPDLTHCSLVLRLGKREAHTEVYAGEPESIQRLMRMVLRILERYGWQPIPG